MTIEERIQELRKGKGLSQEQLAEILGVSRQAVSKWEGGQSLPEIEKLIAMSELFEVTIDYILKGETPASETSFKPSRFASQVVSAVATMLLAVGIFAAIGQLSDGSATMDIYGGLIIESVGIMLLLIGWFLGGNRVVNKPLFVVNILLAGVLPSSLISQTLLRFKPSPTPPFHPIPILLFSGAYLLICGTIIYFAVIRKSVKN